MQKHPSFIEVLINLIPRCIKDIHAKCFMSFLYANLLKEEKFLTSFQNLYLSIAFMTSC